MKKVLSILFALLICVSLAATAHAARAPRLYDGADLLTSSEERELSDKLKRISEGYQVDVVIATVDSTEGYGADWYVEAYYDDNGYGYGDSRDGVILLVAMAERDYRILSNGFGARAITMDEIYEIGDRIAGDLSDGDYYDAFHGFIDACVYEIDGEINGFPFDFGMNLAVSLLIGCAAAFIATGIMRGQLKSVRSRSGAREYTRPGSMKVTHAGDLFLYRTVDRRPRPKPSSSSSSGHRGGGGGSRNVGGGKF